MYKIHMIFIVSPERSAAAGEVRTFSGCQKVTEDKPEQTRQCSGMYVYHSFAVV